MGDAVKMTDLQISIKVLQRFPLRSQFDLSYKNSVPDEAKNKIPRLSRAV
jgi:hypothetical protein